MTEIKSRAWIKSKSIFYYDFAKVPYDLKMGGVLYRIFSGRMDKPQLLQSEFEENLFTGLQDITGKDIYEGDVYEYDNDLYVIKYSNENACFMAALTDSECIYLLDKTKIRIIGNIYENPELIEASK